MLKLPIRGSKMKTKNAASPASSGGQNLAPSENEAGVSTKGGNTKREVASTIKPQQKASVNSVKPKSKKPVFDEFEDPVPRKRVEKKKSSFWQTLCCKSAGAATTEL